MERDIEQACRELTLLLEETPDREALLERCVGFFSRSFAVQRDEVAIFELERERQLLHFLVPRALRKVGYIPLSSLDSLAARTARDVNVFLENTFAALRHASCFEKLRLDSTVKETPKPIQKLISVPLLAGETVVGVIQISRKGLAGDDAIPDFVEADAVLLVALARVLGARL